MPHFLWCRLRYSSEKIYPSRFVFNGANIPASDEEKYNRHLVEQLAEPDRPEVLYSINPVDNIRQELNQDLLQAFESKVGQYNGSEALTEERQLALMQEAVIQEYLKELADKGENIEKWTKKHRKIVNERLETMFGKGKMDPKKKAAAEKVWSWLGRGIGRTPQQDAVSSYALTLIPPIKERFSGIRPRILNLLMSATPDQLEKLRDNVEVHGNYFLKPPVTSSGISPAVRHAPTPFDRLLSLSRIEIKGEYQMMTPSIAHHERLESFVEKLKNKPSTGTIYNLLTHIAGQDSFYAPGSDDHLPDSAQILAERTKNVKSAIVAYIDRYLRNHIDQNAPQPADPEELPTFESAAIDDLENQLHAILEGLPPIEGDVSPETSIHKRQLTDAIKSIGDLRAKLSDLYKKADETRAKIEAQRPIKDAELNIAQATIARNDTAYIDSLHTAAQAAAQANQPGRTNINIAEQTYKNALAELKAAKTDEARLTQEIKALDSEKTSIVHSIQAGEQKLIGKAQYLFTIMSNYKGLPDPIQAGTTTDDPYPQLRSIKDLLARLNPTTDLSTEDSLFGTGTNPPTPNPVQEAIDQCSAEDLTGATTEIGKYIDQKMQKREAMEDLSKLLLRLNEWEVEKYAAKLPTGQPLSSAKKDRLSLGLMFYQSRTADEMKELEKIVNVRSAEHLAGLTQDEDVRFYQSPENHGVFSGEEAFRYLCGLPKHEHFVPFGKVSLYSSQATFESIIEANDGGTRHAYELAEKLKVLINGKAKGRIIRQDAAKVGNLVEKLYRARDAVYVRRFSKKLDETRGTKAELIAQRIGPYWEEKHQEELDVKRQMAEDKDNGWAEAFQRDLLKAQYFDDYKAARLEMAAKGLKGKAATEFMQGKGMTIADQQLRWAYRGNRANEWTRGKLRNIFTRSKTSNEPGRLLRGGTKAAAYGAKWLFKGVEAVMGKDTWDDSGYKGKIKAWSERIIGPKNTPPQLPPSK